MVTPARIAPAVQKSLEGGGITELFAVHPIGVDQPTRRPQSELGVMSKNHLTYDPSDTSVMTKEHFTHYIAEVHPWQQHSPRLTTSGSACCSRSAPPSPSVPPDRSRS